MANERKPKTSKNKNLEQKVVAASTLTPSSMSRKNNVSRMPESSSSPDNSHSPSDEDDKVDESESEEEEMEEEKEEEEEMEEEEEEEEEKEEKEDKEDKEDIDDENVNDDEVENDEEKNETPSLSWPKSDDFELFKRIRKASPKDDAMKYDSRVNHLNWESIQFQDYSAEQCKSRWLHIQTHLRHYRILAEVLEDAALWVDRPWYNFNKGGKNNQKHPDQPKKPLTSYMLFYMKKKDSVLEKQPGLGMTELSKIIAKMYHELSDRKKTKYSEMAEKEKEAYHEKMKKFIDANPDYVVPKSKQTAKAVPPKPPTPFKLFSDEKTTKYISEGMTPIEARERCRDSYKELKDKQKLKWIYKSLKQEHEYNEELEKFKANHPDVDVAAKKLNLLTKDELQLKHKSEGKPEKPPNSGYNLFSKKLLSSNSLRQFETKERMSEISKLWKELSDEEKSSLNVKATQMNHSYKIKYASYIETLTPEQRNAELVSSVGLNMKRPAGKKLAEQLVGKKQKIGSAVDVGSSSDSDEDVVSDEENLKIVPKTTIQKPISSLQMFCNSNLNKYSSKHPKLAKQELTRLMAKEFAKLSDDKKKIYGNMAQKSKNKMSPTSKSTMSKVKTEKTSEKVSVKSATTETALKSPTRGSSSKKNAVAANSDSKSLKSPKCKPSLNANVKLTDKMPSKTIKSPFWAASQSLFKTENTIEPPKPPESAAAYYVMKHHSKTGNLSTADIDILWGKVSEKQKKKYIEEHIKKQKNYAVEFENFVRLLKSDELKAFRSFMKNRVQIHGQDGAQNMSSDESASINSNEDRRSGACSDDESQIYSDED